MRRRDFSQRISAMRRRLLKAFAQSRTIIVRAAAIAVLAVPCMTPAKAANWIYTVHFKLRDANNNAAALVVNGTITTNCVNCLLGPNNVVSWTFNLGGKPLSSDPSSNPYLSIFVNSTIYANVDGLVLNPHQPTIGSIEIGDNYPWNGSFVDNYFIFSNSDEPPGWSIGLYFNTGLAAQAHGTGPFLIANRRGEFVVRSFQERRLKQRRLKRRLSNSPHRERVGWVERSETHRFCGLWRVSLRSSHPTGLTV